MLKAISVVTLFAIGTSVTAKRSPRVPMYEIRFDEARPNTAEVRLSDPPRDLMLARAGAAGAIAGLSCGDRTLPVVGDCVAVPSDSPVLA